MFRHFVPSRELGWLGLGYVDGYDVDVKRSIFRKPKLQVFCIVIDGNLAAKIIPSALENTPFSICDVSVNPLKSQVLIQRKVIGRKRA